MFLSLKKKQNQITTVNTLSTKKNNGGTGRKILNFLQELGKSLQYPIAVLPFAAILNRFGTLGITYTSSVVGTNLVINNAVGYWISFIIQQPGAVVFNNLPLIFAIGVAFGLAKDHRGEVALIGGIFYLILGAMTQEHSLPEMIYHNVLTFKTPSGNYSQLFYVPEYGPDGVTIIGQQYVLSIGVFGGIVSGCLSAFMYDRLKEIKLPQALSFFGGRRFVPMVALVVAIPTALLFAVIWPWFQFALMKLGQQIADPNNPAVSIPGTAVYGVLNRLLLPFGLHQILNTFFWFQLPIHGVVVDPITGHTTGNPIWVNGDINAFTKGVAGSGLFQSGFFPIMMGGIPAIAIAMIFTAKKENRKTVTGFLSGVALVSFVSGITEPIEYSFVFISPLLLAIHALLTGIFVAITTALHIQVGFGFSAGLIDYCVSIAQSWGFSNYNTGFYHISSNPLWMLLLILVCGGTYFIIFSTLIKKMNIKTIGREENFAENSKTNVNITIAKGKKSKDKYAVLATKLIQIIGKDNFVTVDNCATRLRLKVKDTGPIDANKIKAAGAFGALKLNKESLQIVIGADVEFVANEIQKQLNNK